MIYSKYRCELRYILIWLCGTAIREFVPVGSSFLTLLTKRFDGNQGFYDLRTHKFCTFMTPGVSRKLTTTKILTICEMCMVRAIVLTAVLDLHKCKEYDIIFTFLHISLLHIKSKLRKKLFKKLVNADVFILFD